MPVAGHPHQPDPDRTIQGNCSRVQITQNSQICAGFALIAIKPTLAHIG